MSRYKLKFMYDWGSGVCVWSDNAAAKEKFKDYPVNTAALPITRELAALLEELNSRHDTALNWDDPGGELLWDRAKQEAFTEEAKAAYRRLCAELGPDYEVFFFPRLFC